MHAYRAPTHSEIDSLAAIEAQAFGVALPDAHAWLASVGHENFRVFVDDGQVTGGLLVYSMGQWFGGRSVPMAGIAGVGVDPTVRGRGVATRMMRAAVGDLAASGFALSCLYAATQPLYRRAGYEQGGSRFRIRIPTSELALGDHSLALRHASPEDDAAIRALYRSQAALRSGSLDRSPLLWNRIVAPQRRTRPMAYVVERQGTIEGYCYLRREHRPDERQEVHVDDLAVSSPQAATTLLSFLGDHRSLADEVVWYGSASDPLLMLLREQRQRVELQEAWMLRILDVRRALEGRGWPAGVSTSLHLEVFDEVLPANQGRFVAEIDGGRSEVRAGGDGLFQVHVRGLAALYSGYSTPGQLALIGLAEGADHVLEAAATAFAGPAPAMSDFF